MTEECISNAMHCDKYFFGGTSYEKDFHCFGVFDWFGNFRRHTKSAKAFQMNLPAASGGVLDPTANKNRVPAMRGDTSFFYSCRGV
jgi:hypothetical protein